MNKKSIQETEAFLSSLIPPPSSLLFAHPDESRAHLNRCGRGWNLQGARRVVLKLPGCVDSCACVTFLKVSIVGRLALVC
jgi:hypothetical protein